MPAYPMSNEPEYDIDNTEIDNANGDSDSGTESAATDQSRDSIPPASLPKDNDQPNAMQAPFSVRRPMGEGVTSDPQDIKSTALALNKLNYYKLPPHAGLYWMEDQGFRSALRQFQADNGLKVDGRIYPNGPTMRTFNRELDRIEPPNLNSMRRDFDPSTVPLFGDSILSTEQQSERFFLRKLLEQEALQERYSRYDRPKPPPDAEPKTMITPEQLAALSSAQLSSLTSEQLTGLNSTQLGETSDKPLKETQAQGNNASNRGKTAEETTIKSDQYKGAVKENKKISMPDDEKDPNDTQGRKIWEVKAANDPSYSPKYGNKLYPPAWKNDFNLAMWRDLNDAIEALPGATPQHKDMLRNTMAAEGHKVDSNGSKLGILKRTLKYAKSAEENWKVPGLEKVNTPSELSAENVIDIYDRYLDILFKKAGGREAALGKISDPDLATAIADTLIRFGPGDGMEALVAAMVTSGTEKGSLGTIGMGPLTMDALAGYDRNPEKKIELIKNLHDVRVDLAEKIYKKEVNSNDKLSKEEKQNQININAPTHRKAESSRVNNIFKK